MSDISTQLGLRTVRIVEVDGFQVVPDWFSGRNL